ncbi:sarcosine oxidase subunit gamma [Corticibacterium sp. UT-5YL-CI-8]|nr:sarcosine oxidase subunit gamma [Tianweitania sp. UT-5YL-CI-8]
MGEIAKTMLPASIPALRRAGPLDGRVAVSGALSLTVLPPASRLSLRAPAGSVADLSAALGLDLPQAPKTSASDGNGRFALWLGPDEWLVIDETSGDLVAACRAVPALHSAVDISHRNVGLLVSGQGAADAVNAGCPQDLSLESFPVGACSRTVLGKIEIVLHRLGEDAFRVECWRSFAGYAQAFLAEAIADASA